MKRSQQITVSLAPPIKARVNDPRWLDVGDIARGVGFTGKVAISAALSDALEPVAAEREDSYDQRVYDTLWQAHFQLVRDQLRSTTFNFSFQRADWKPSETTDIRLRLRVATWQEAVVIGLLDDF